MQKKIIVVEDDMSLRKDLCEYLQDKNFAVKGVGSARHFFELYKIFVPDIVLLDINLPDNNGYSIAVKVREQAKDIGIIMLTCRSSLEDRIHGLDIGADAYLVKHTDLKEIEATIKSVLRRLGKDATNSHSMDYVWTFDFVKWAMISPNNIEVNLTSTEYIFMSIMIKHKGQLVSRDVIAKEMGRPLREDIDRGIDAIVKRLRNKVEKKTGIQLPLKLVYGTGYAFTARTKVIKK